MDTTTIVLIVLLAVAVVAAIVAPIVTTLLSRARYEARTQRASLLNSEVTELRDQLTQARDSETAGKLEIERLKAENRAAEDKLKTLEKAEVTSKRASKTSPTEYSTANRRSSPKTAPKPSATS